MRQYYVPQVTELSEQELQAVFEAAEPPVCLLGGWAVHLHVTPGFHAEHGREYIGSRDIDMGVHVDASWTVEELPTTPVGDSISAIENLGYTKSRFGFVQNFLRDSQERISEGEASQHSMHDVFQVYIDVIPDTTELDVFREVFGFKPPAEPLLAPAFEENKGERLAEYVSWSPGAEKLIVSPELLAAMKIRSLPDRDKSHKRVKDVADLHALLWYVTDYTDMKTGALEYVSDSDVEQFADAVDDILLEEAASLLQIEPQLITNSINRLLQ
ncbi:nucleotidyl transferase AbiEii/AbiGii toxin family protein [Halanaeroarchaeum sulfurireducens]|uniref:nucleotidyl transferase AbiEii/AbiGii toxin family protein n=1 Tax=Halanaeroarchaeum sulfurireducens TaxID=1604004 RepID=UPI000A66B8B9|nr:nucleotidyl transferase AbiEii/AbiGii toxin family protein [Halanaeroarchaeum sulfurireducens]